MNSYLALFGVLIILIILVSCVYAIICNARKQSSRPRRLRQSHQGTGITCLMRAALKTSVRHLINPLHMIVGNIMAR
jgi:hypothetical protein